jgi:hypothetical protein
MTFYQLLALGSAAIAVLGGAWGAARLRGERRFSAVAVVLSAAGPMASLWLYLLLTRVELKLTATLALASLGALVGLAVGGRLLKLAARPGAVVVRGGAWLSLPSVLAIAGLQLCATFGSRSSFVLALAALELAVAFGVGAALALVARRLALRPVPLLAPPTEEVSRGPVAAATSTRCPRCGAPTHSEWRFCRTCWLRLTT